MKKLFFLMAASFLFAPVHAQITERERPAEWQHLVKGARFMDRFLPMPDGIQAKGIYGRQISSVCVWLARELSERSHVLVKLYRFSCGK